MKNKILHVLNERVFIKKSLETVNGNDQAKEEAFILTLDKEKHIAEC